MPIRKVWCRDENRFIDRYDDVMLRLGPNQLTESQCDEFLAFRKEAIKDLEHWQSEKKTYEKSRDFENAKFCRTQINESSRFVTALQYVLPWYLSNPPKDCIEKAPFLWPVELVYEFDMVFRKVETIVGI